MQSEEIYQYMCCFFKLHFTKICFDYDIPLKRLKEGNIALFEGSYSYETDILDSNYFLVFELFQTIPLPLLIEASISANLKVNHLSKYEADQDEVEEIISLLIDHNNVEDYIICIAENTPNLNFPSEVGTSTVIYSTKKNYLGWIYANREDIQEYYFDPANFPLEELILDVHYIRNSLLKIQEEVA